MSEPIEITPTETRPTETAPTTPEAEGVLTKVKTELRAAGETGKRQWQDAFTKSREGAARFRADWTKVAERTRLALGDAYARAEARGASLLLHVVSQVRASAETFERSLGERAKAAPPAAPDQGAPAAAH